MIYRGGYSGRILNNIYGYLLDNIDIFLYDEVN